MDPDILKDIMEMYDSNHYKNFMTEYEKATDSEQKIEVFDRFKTMLKANSEFLPFIMQKIRTMVIKPIYSDKICKSSKWKNIEFYTELSVFDYDKHIDLKKNIMTLMAFILPTEESPIEDLFLQKDSDTAWKHWNIRFDKNIQETPNQIKDVNSFTSMLNFLKFCKFINSLELMGEDNDFSLNSSDGRKIHNVIKAIFMIVDQICSKCHKAVFLTMIPIIEEGSAATHEDESESDATGLNLFQPYGAKTITDFIGNDTQKWCRLFRDIPDDLKVSVLLPAPYSELKSESSESEIVRINSALQDFARIVRCHMPSNLSDGRHSLPGLMQCAKVDRCCFGIGKGKRNTLSRSKTSRSSEDKKSQAVIKIRLPQSPVPSTTDQDALTEYGDRLLKTPDPKAGEEV